MSAGKAEFKIELLGESRSPLILIDGGTNVLTELRRGAMSSCQFSPDKISSYPGLRAPLPQGYVVGCVRPLLPSLYKIFKIPSHLKPYPRDNYYSLVTKRGGELSPIQTLPHFDTNNPYTISIIHYLNEGDFGGTGFFRHKPTGYECIDLERRPGYLKSVESYLLNNMNIMPAYCDESHPEFEMYKSIGYKANRMLIFQGYFLHSGLICEDRDLSPSPTLGRLTANMFIEFR